MKRPSRERKLTLLYTIVFRSLAAFYLLMGVVATLMPSSLDGLLQRPLQEGAHVLFAFVITFVGLLALAGSFVRESRVRVLFCGAALLGQLHNLLGHLFNYLQGYEETILLTALVDVALIAGLLVLGVRTFKAPAMWALLYEPGPGWLPGKSLAEQPLKDHLAYLMRLHRQGRVLMGGPFDRDSGGLVLASAENREAASEILSHDPAVQSSVLTATLHRWNRAV